MYVLAADEAKIAANSTDVIQLLRTLQELLQNAIQKKRPTRLWESVYTISGPLTWKDFHLLAGRGWLIAHVHTGPILPVCNVKSSQRGTFVAF